MKTFGPGGLPGSVRPPLIGRLLRRSAASSSCTNRREDVARQSSGRHTGGDLPRPCEQASDAPLPPTYVVLSLPSSMAKTQKPLRVGAGAANRYGAARRARTAANAASATRTARLGRAPGGALRPS